MNDAGNGHALSAPEQHLRRYPQGWIGQVYVPKMFASANDSDRDARWIARTANATGCDAIGRRAWEPRNLDTRCADRANRREGVGTTLDRDSRLRNFSRKPLDRGGLPKTPVEPAPATQRTAHHGMAEGAQRGSEILAGRRNQRVFMRVFPHRYRSDFATLRSWQRHQLRCPALIETPLVFAFSIEPAR